MQAPRRIDHVCLRVRDLEEASARWAIQFGLTPRPDDNGERVLLRCGYEPYALELIQGEPGFDHHAWELPRGVELTDAASELEGSGVKVDRRDGALFLSDADGVLIELLAYRPPDVIWPDVARSSSELPGFRPRKLGHVNFLTGRLAEQAAFYTNVLGLAVTDRLGAEGTWLHCNADHHAFALVNKGYPHIHHVAFELVDWGELRVALDHLAQHGRWLGWGPVRHGLGRNLSAYVRIPEEELFVELFCDIEQLEPDHEPREWPDDNHSSNVWGILPPRSYFRFDRAAVEAERQGLEALGYGLPPAEDVSLVVEGSS